MILYEFDMLWCCAVCKSGTFRNSYGSVQGSNDRSKLVVGNQARASIRRNSHPSEWIVPTEHNGVFSDRLLGGNRNHYVSAFKAWIIAISMPGEQMSACRWAKQSRRSQPVPARFEMLFDRFAFVAVS